MRDETEPVTSASKSESPTQPLNSLPLMLVYDATPPRPVVGLYNRRNLRLSLTSDSPNPVANNVVLIDALTVSVVPEYVVAVKSLLTTPAECVYVVG